MKGLFLNNFEYSNSILLWKCSNQIRNIEKFPFIVVLLVSFLLTEVKVSTFLDVSYFPGYPVNTLLNELYAVLEFALPGLLNVEEELVDEFSYQVDHALLVCHCFRLLEKNHASFFK